MGRDLGLVCKLSCCSIKINQILTRCFLSKSQFAPPICIHKSLVESDEAFASTFPEKNTINKCDIIAFEKQALLNIQVYR